VPRGVLCAVHQPSGEVLRCRHAITASRPGAMGFTLQAIHTRRTLPKFSRPCGAARAQAV